MTLAKIYNIGIHKLNKTDEGFSYTIGNTELAGSEHAVDLINLIYNVFDTKKGKNYGEFSSEVTKFPSVIYVNEFIDSDGELFHKFTENMMIDLSERASHRNAAAGHVIFSFCQNEKNMIIICALLNEKASKSITEDFKVNQVKHFDIDHLRFAGQIDISSWKNKEKKYISFVRGRGNVAEYFSQFLGCQVSANPKKLTLSLYDALEEISKKSDIPTETQKGFTSAAYEFMSSKANKSEPIIIQELCSELSDYGLEELEQKIYSSDLKISDHFVPDKSVLSHINNLELIGTGWKLKLAVSAFGQGTAIYNRGSSTLTLSGIKEESISKILEHIDD